MPIARSYAVCSACGAGHFPPDEELGLVAGALSPCAQAGLVRLGARLPFARAADELADFWQGWARRAPGRRRTPRPAHRPLYYSRLADAATFTRLSAVEARRRGVSTAGTVVAVTNGGLWLQGCLDEHRPDAVCILDCPRAVEHLTAAWGAAQAHARKHGDPAEVLRALLDLPVRAAPPPAAPPRRRSGRPHP